MSLRPAAAIVHELREFSASTVRRCTASCAVQRRRVAKESTAIASLLELAARRPIERQSDDDLLFVMPKHEAAPAGKKRPRSVAPAPAPAASPAPDTHQFTHRIRRSRDLRKPVLAGAMVAGGLAI